MKKERRDDIITEDKEGQKLKMSGWTAQICQHEIDHLEGRII